MEWLFYYNVSSNNFLFQVYTSNINIAALATFGFSLHGISFSILLISSPCVFEFKICLSWVVFPSGAVVKNPPANARDARNMGLIPGLGRSPGEENGNPLQYSCLELLSHFSHVWLCVTPQTAAHQAPPSLGFSRQEHWSGLPFPSPRVGWGP